jgi:hypothetical protein
VIDDVEPVPVPFGERLQDGEGGITKRAWAHGTYVEVLYIRISRTLADGKSAQCFVR